MIDLDVAPPQPIGAGRPARVAPGAPRRLAAGVLTLLLALALGGATSPPGLTTVLTVDRTTQALVLGGSSLFTASTGGGANLRRHALPGGTVQWSATVPYDIQELRLAGGVLLAIPTFAAPESFLDADTGRLLWRNTDPDTDIALFTRNGVLLVARDGPGVTTLRLADPHTGRTRWSRVQPSLAHFGFDPLSDTPTRLTVVTADGRATVLAVDDGTELADADLGVRLTPGARDGDHVDVITSDRHLYVSSRIGGATSLTAYGLADLRVRWRSPGTPDGLVLDCADAVCVGGEQGMAVLDRDDGTVRWTNQRWHSSYDVDAGQPAPARHRLIAFGAQDPADSVLLDPATGQVLRRLGRTLPLGPLLLRSDTEIPSRTWVSTRDRRGAFHLAGSVDTPTPHACSTSGRYLACLGTNGPATVRRLP